MLKNKCVIYARFSSEDELINGKSRSISNQVDILKEYAKEQGFNVTKVYEDYMYSGRDFNRPQVKELIKAANNKEFDILLLKDLSRLGRNYIDVGTHLEKTFIENGIRVIAINDFYDSSVDFDYLTVALKNYLNDLYIRDVSKKIIRVTLSRGKYEYLGGFHYGYKIIDKKISIYEPEAKIVRRIFKEVMEGKTITSIAAELTKEKVLKRSVNHAYKMGYKEDIDYNDESLYSWKHNDVANILKDQFFIGRVINFNLKKKNRKIESEQIILENNHEAIIKKEDFDFVNSSLIRYQNLKINKENIRKVIFCKKCLARNRYDFTHAHITPTIIDGNEVYHDYRCRKSYPIELINRRIYDMLLLKHKDILDHKEKYIENIINEKYYNATALKEIAETKRKYEKKGQSLFESYVNGVISQDVFSNKMAEINKIITDCDDRLNGTKFEEFNYDEINQKVTKFLDEFNPDEDNIIKVIEENVAKAIYDPEKGSFVIILKFEEEIDIPSLNIKNFIKPEIGRRSEWDLDDIVYKIICDNPSIKGKGIYDEAKKVWEGFTFKGVERSIRSLRLKNMIKKEGKADLVDGYVKIDYVEDFDYHGMELNRKEKDIYKMLWYNPKMNYKELAEATNSHLDTAIKAVRKIRRLGGFEFSQFDKTYIPKGAFHSIYVEDKRIAAEVVKRIYRDIDQNPNVTPDEIKTKFNITLEQAQTYIERRRMKNENRNQ